MNFVTRSQLRLLWVQVIMKKSVFHDPAKTLVPGLKTLFFFANVKLEVSL